jgi:hypothetical protein
MIIAVTNESTVATDAQLDLIARACQYQLRYHLCPQWGLSTPSVVAIPKGSMPPSTDVILHVKDTSDQPGALGYHDDDTIVEAFAFAKTDQQYGADLGVTISHEIVELVVDRWCLAAMQNPNTGYFYALEVGDPVEADNDGYSVTIKDALGATHSLRVSNFILPAWYLSGSAGPYDHVHLLSKPWQVRPGGYVSIWKGQGQWTQYQAKKTADAALLAAQTDGSLVVVESKSPRQRVRGEL